jgi:hypothetical protein
LWLQDNHFAVAGNGGAADMRKWAYDFTSSKPIKGILAAFNAARPLAVGAA